MKPFNRLRKTSRRPSRGTRAVRSAAWPARRAAWAIEERLVWGGADAARAAAGEIGWPIERLGWALRRNVVWRVQDWFRAWGPIARAIFVLALLWIGFVACLTVVRIADKRDSDRRPEAVALTAGRAVGAAPSAARGAAPAPVLHGAAPTFTPAEHESGARPAVSADAAAAAPGPSARVAVPNSRRAPVAALRVAHRFAAAFVVYEVGKVDHQIRRVLRATATAPVIRALAERPPRQPAAVDVPEARVLNVVPGPRHGPNLSVSVSLLRLRATSELRLQMERTSDGWLVSDVRG